MFSRVAPFLVALALASCTGERSMDGTAGQPRPRTTTEQRSEWPSTEIGPAIECVHEYPEALANRMVAFDGTIIDVRAGSYQRGPSATPVRLDVKVNEVFRGDLGPTVTMNTWKFMLPRHDVTGTRILAAAGAALDLMACGFTRPYSEDDAQYWREVFSA